jgi:hypothetical protein
VTFKKMQVHCSVPKNDGTLLRQFFGASSPNIIFRVLLGSGPTRSGRCGVVAWPLSLVRLSSDHCFAR